MSEGLVRQTLSGQVADELRREIRVGATPPGTRLRQRDVAERYQVSITPVREAFSQLEREGLLVNNPHRGVLVFHPTADDLSEIYDIRIPLEVLAAEKAALCASEAEIAELAELVTRMGQVIRDADRYTHLNRDFHMLICRTARSPRLEKLIGDLRDASSAYLRMFTALLPTGEQSQADHEAILHALRDRDAERVGGLVRRHLEETVGAVRGRLGEQHPS